MPQMSPMDWMMLMLFFSTIYMLFLVYIYFVLNVYLIKKIEKLTLKLFLLKWY
uniref:ATP synthase FO subunit 8 n=1 Tax=Fornicia albalata TaxID=1911503 RepID=A0A6F8AL15_9HYME|nr:ATP synthase FO subunit 8 [Fornicia albalata]